VPVGGSGYVYLPIQAYYVSGPRCDLRITVTAELTGSGRPESAAGTIQGVIGPAKGERETTLYKFLWQNWCMTSQQQIQVVVAGGGHTTKTAISQRPECFNASQSDHLNWGGTM
jgi:hypothetical protein